MRSWTSFRVDSESFAEVFAGNCIGMYRDCGVSVPVHQCEPATTTCLRQQGAAV